MEHDTSYTQDFFLSGKFWTGPEGRERWRLLRVAAAAASIITSPRPREGRRSWRLVGLLVPPPCQPQHGDRQERQAATRPPSWAGLGGFGQLKDKQSDLNAVPSITPQIPPPRATTASPAGR